jgi:hypothetical protein
MRAARPARRAPRRAATGVRLALAAALLGVAVPATGVASAEPCPGRAVGRWERLATPPRTASVLPLRTACAFLALDPAGTLWRTSGGGWSEVPAPPLARAFADPRSGTVVGALRSGGVAVSRDDGRTFAVPAVGPAGNVVAAAVSRALPPALVVATVADTPPLPPVPTVWRSTDGGASFAVAGAAPATPAALAFDPGSPDALWLAAPGGSGTGGVWRSPDAGTTWQPALSDLPAYDVDLARGPGGSVAVVARDDGLWRSTTNGSTWTRTPAPPLSAVRIDSGGPGAVALSRGRPVRIDAPAFPGRTLPLGRGLPPGCPADSLSSDAALPATFVLRCGEGWYAHASAADPNAADRGTTDPDLPVGDARRLTELARLDLPTDDGTHSGSLAFDGRALYYAGEFRAAGAEAPIDTVHLISPHDGRSLGTLDVGHPAKRLTYDPHHDRLYVDDGRSMWRVATGGGRAGEAFPATLSYTWSFDASTRTFVGTYEGDEDRTMLTLNEAGIVVARCSLNGAVPARNSPYAAPSAVVAAVDGAYVLLEDDTTVIRVRRDCTREAIYLTKTISESPLENDSLVCDPLTFAPRTALWMRDGAVAQVVAYALPDGFCPFHATLAVSAPPSVTDGAPARVCATLRRTGRGEPIAGQAVTLDVDGVLLAAPPTDAHGRTCATSRLTAAPRDPSPRSTTTTTPAPARTAPAVSGRAAPVRARYAGTAQWTPASATGSTTVLPLALPRVPNVPPAVPDDVPGPDTVPGRAGPLAPPNPPADPAHVPHPQSQPQAQQNPGQQPGTQAGLAPDDEEAPALVLAEDSGEETYAMSRRDATPDPAIALLGAALVTAAAGYALRLQTSPAPDLLRPGRRRPRDPRRRGHAVRRGR